MQRCKTLPDLCIVAARNCGQELLTSVSIAFQSQPDYAVAGRPVRYGHLFNAANIPDIAGWFPVRVGLVHQKGTMAPTPGLEDRHTLGIA